MEEFCAAKEKEAKRLLSRRDTIHNLCSISREASKIANDYRANMFALSLRRQMGNSQLNAELQEIENRRNEFKDGYDAMIREICESESFKNAQAKLAKDINKKIAKLYKKASEEHGKKVANVLFNAVIPEITKTEVGVYQSKMKKTSKKMVKLDKELHEKLAEIDEDRKLVEKEIEESELECPRLAPEDLSLADQSNLSGHKKVKLPGDAFTQSGGDVREMIGKNLEGLVESEDGLEITPCGDLTNLANLEDMDDIVDAKERIKDLEDDKD